MTRRLLSAVAATAILIGVLALPQAASAAETDYDACPDSASAWLDDGVTAYPPYDTSAPGDPSALIGCAGPYSGVPGQLVNAVTGYTFAGLPTDPCNVVTGITAISTGTPGGFGWPVLAFNSDTGNPVIGVDGFDGFFQQWGRPQGVTVPTHGVVVVSPVDQPASGSYAVSYDLDPAGISLVDLAAGNLSLTAIVLNRGDAADDVVESLQVSVVVDDAGCTVPTSTTTTTTPTTTSTTTPTTTVAPTTTAAAQPQALTPTFTG